MVSFTNVLVNAISISALYAIVAIGFTLIFGVGGVLNFSHGALITVGAEAAYFVSNGTKLGLSPWIGLLAGAATAGIVGGILYLGVVRFVEDEPVTLLILTFIIGFFIQNAARVFLTGTGSFTIPQVTAGGDPAVSLAGISVLKIDVFIFVLSLLLIALTIYFVTRTKTGKAVLAVSMSEKGAGIVGIDSRKINLITWLLASTFAGVAGVLLLMKNGGAWNMGTSPLILAFSIVILGGLGSIKGSVVGAYIIGFTETFTTQYVDPSLQGFTALLLLIVFLLVKPEGLYGREAAG